jgi:hypothetical protein
MCFHDPEADALATLALQMEKLSHSLNDLLKASSKGRVGNWREAVYPWIDQGGERGSKNYITILPR